MKAIMAKESTKRPQGVPSFVFNPRDPSEPPLIELERPLDELKRILCKDLAGRRMTMRKIYELHSNGRRYIEQNYKEALRQLEADNKIKATPPACERRKSKGQVTFGDGVAVEFP